MALAASDADRPWEMNVNAHPPMPGSGQAGGSRVPAGGIDCDRLRAGLDAMPGLSHVTVEAR